MSIFFFQLSGYAFAGRPYFLRIRRQVHCQTWMSMYMLIRVPYWLGSVVKMRNYFFVKQVVKFSVNRAISKMMKSDSDDGANLVDGFVGIQLRIKVAHVHSVSEQLPGGLPSGNM